MPSYTEVTHKRTRDVEVVIDDVRYTCTQSLMSQGKGQIEARIQFSDIYTKVSELTKEQDELQKLNLSTEEKAAKELEIVNKLNAAAGSINERKSVCDLICTSVIKWDVQDVNGVTLPLISEELYDSAVPNEFLDEFWKGLTGEPLVPKARSRTLKRTST